MSKTPVNRRRWFQFSLLGLLSVITASAVVIFIVARPKPAFVEGMVTVNGQTLNNGEIEFALDSRKKKFKMRKAVSNGRYSFSDDGIPAGVYEVRVRSPKRTHEIPARYNSATELRVELRPGENEIAFDLSVEN